MSKLIPSIRLQPALNLDVWSIFNPASMPKNAINLGQGFMNWSPPKFATEAATHAISNQIEPNHYSHPRGRINLRNAISESYSKSFGKEKLCQDSEIVVTSGANEGTYAAMLAFINPGDEVIFIQPFFDQYSSAVTFQGGIPIYVPLRPPTSQGNSGPAKISAKDWVLDLNELSAAFNSKTKAIIINSPHNPVGKVFSRQELEMIADLAIKHDVLVISDEVYENLVYPPNQHIRFATLPGMWERTLTVFSAGKSFACTGWRIGWLVGPANLIGPTLTASTRVVFCSNSPMQEAVAIALQQAEANNFFQTQLEQYTKQGEILMKAFDDVGLPYTVPQGGYFILVDMSGLNIPEDFDFPDVLNGRGADFK